MISHVIYEIPGIKVGCTKDLTRRSIENRLTYGDDIVIKVLKELHDLTNREAGDTERNWQIKLGYPTNVHYADLGWVTGAAGRAGLESQFAKGIHASQTGKTAFHTGAAGRIGGKRCGELGKSGFQTGAAGRRTAELGKNAFQQKATCPRCGRVGQLANMKRWHFDNCRNV